MNEFRLALNLWLAPIELLIAGFVLSGVGDRFREHSLLGPLAIAVNYAAIAVVITAAGWFAWSARKLYRATQGKGDICHTCGMPTRANHSGRYGPYLKCMACGTTRRLIL
jgi:hypothetical protein